MRDLINNDDADMATVEMRWRVWGFNEAGEGFYELYDENLRKGKHPSVAATEAVSTLNPNSVPLDTFMVEPLPNKG